jgi:hypothetical protein
MTSARFIGTLVFSDEQQLEHGLDAFFAHEPDVTMIDLLELRRTGLEISIRYHEEVYSGADDALHAKLAALAAHAASGAIETNTYRKPLIHAGQVANAAPSPARHHRYEAYFAARCGDAETLRSLVAQGVALDVRYRHGTTLLHLAAWCDSAEAVEVLIAAGLDLEAVTTHGGTPLGNATLAAARALLAAGANPNAPRGAGDRSILFAGCERGEALGELLLAAGAAPRPHELVGLARSCVAAQHLGLLRSLVTHVPELRAALASPRVIEAAIGSRNPVVLDYLLENGAELPADFLAMAVEKGAIMFVEAALRAPDAIAACGVSNRTTDAMCVAARRGSLEIVQLLAGRGVPIQPPAKGETSPFAQAIRGGRREVIAWLLARGVPFDLSLKYYARDPATLMMFVERGVDPHDDSGLREDFSHDENVEFARLLAEWEAKR